MFVGVTKKLHNVFSIYFLKFLFSESYCHLRLKTLYFCWPFGLEPKVIKCDIDVKDSKKNQNEG